jgi:hypothetical protein
MLLGEHTGQLLPDLGLSRVRIASLRASMAVA